MDRLSTPTQVDGIESVAKLASGADHVCALTTAGEVYCWGSHGYLQLGPLATGDTPTRVRVEGLN